MQHELRVSKAHLVSFEAEKGLTSTIHEDYLWQYRLSFLGKHLKNNLMETKLKIIMMTITESTPFFVIEKNSISIYISIQSNWLFSIWKILNASIRFSFQITHFSLYGKVFFLNPLCTIYSKSFIYFTSSTRFQAMVEKHQISSRVQSFQI